MQDDSETSVVPSLALSYLESFDANVLGRQIKLSRMQGAPCGLDFEIIEIRPVVIEVSDLAACFIDCFQWVGPRDSCTSVCAGGLDGSTVGGTNRGPERWEGGEVSLRMKAGEGDVSGRIVWGMANGGGSTSGTRLVTFVAKIRWRDAKDF